MPPDAVAANDLQGRSLGLARFCDRFVQVGRRPDQSHDNDFHRISVLSGDWLNSITDAGHYSVADAVIGKSIDEYFGHGKRLYESIVPHDYDSATVRIGLGANETTTRPNWIPLFPKQKSDSILRCDETSAELRTRKGSVYHQLRALRVRRYQMTLRTIASNSIEITWSRPEKSIPARSARPNSPSRSRQFRSVAIPSVCSVAFMLLRMRRVGGQFRCVLCMRVPKSERAELTDRFYVARAGSQKLNQINSSARTEMSAPLPASTARVSVFAILQSSLSRKRRKPTWPLSPVTIHAPAAAGLLTTASRRLRRSGRCWQKSCAGFTSAIDTNSVRATALASNSPDQIHGAIATRCRLHRERRVSALCAPPSPDAFSIVF